MYRRSILLITIFVSAILLVSWARANQEQPKLWASVSVSRPLFHAGWTKELLVHFTLVNDGSKTLDPKIESSKIIINGVELKDSGFIFGNGPRDNRWRALPPGDSLEFTYALEEYFREAGIYRVSWKGENFETPTIVFRVMPSPRAGKS
jgi:hypothetical protein